MYFFFIAATFLGCFFRYVADPFLAHRLTFALFFLRYFLFHSYFCFFLLGVVSLFRVWSREYLRRRARFFSRYSASYALRFFLLGSSSFALIIFFFSLIDIF